MQRTAGGNGTLNLTLVIYLIFEWGIEIDLISVWRIELDFVLCEGRKGCPF